MLKRRVDIILSKGHGSQLLWLFAITLACIFIAIFIARVIFNDDILSWQDVVGLFLDPGVFGSFADKGHDIFRLSIALLSIFLFSALLVSVFTNVFENISDSVRNGRRFYNLKDHILILGSGRHLKGILESLKDTKKAIVVMSKLQPTAHDNCIYYYGSRTNPDDLRLANAAKADTIYIIGEDDETDHDAANLQALDLLNEICKDADHDIHCYATVYEHTTTEIFQYLKQEEGSKLLLVDVINDYEYEAQQLMVNTDFLPVIKEKDETKLDATIIGKGDVAIAVAYTIAHLCHYPLLNGSIRKTRITFIDENMKKWMDDFIASRPRLFEISKYSYVSPDGDVTIHEPNSKYGDFLDIEWRFVDSHDSSVLARQVITDSVTSDELLSCIFVCHQDSQQAINTALHLPEQVYPRNEGTKGAYNIAIYLRNSVSLIERANKTGMYGTLKIFGDHSSDKSSQLMTQRSIHGQRVNFIYDKAYSKEPSKDEESAWYKIPEAHKFSSIYSANAMFLRRKCFDISGERLPIYEAEHRRWMMSELIMGYATGEETNRKYFIHADIIPFIALPKTEQEKDKIIIDAMDYILK